MESQFEKDLEILINKSQFEKDLTILINSYSKENDSDTPDFILATYLNAVLDNFNAAVKQREEHYGRQKHLSDLPEAGEDIPLSIQFPVIPSNTSKNICEGPSFEKGL